MSDEALAPSYEADTSASISSISPPATSDKPISLHDAFNSLTDRRNKEAAAERKPAEAAPDEAPPKAEEPAEPKNPPAKADAAEGESPDGEKTEQTTDPDGEDHPPIEPPRSWTKAEKEEFATYPREAQEKIARREQDREATLRRSQNEVAESKKAFEAQLQEAEAQRRQYENALPQLLNTIQSRMGDDFADINTFDDVRKLAREDPVRHGEYQAARQQYIAVVEETKAAQQRQAQEQHATFQRFAEEQDKGASQRIPDLADPEKAKAAQTMAVDYLRGIGFSDDDMAASWNGQKPLYLRDAKLQEMAWKAAKYDAAQKVAKTAAAKPIPTVQRPGVPTSRSDAAQADHKSLLAKLDKTGSREDAFAALMAARRAR